MNSRAAKRFAFSGLERFSRLLGMLTGLTFATAAVPLFLLYAFREALTPDLTALLVVLALASVAFGLVQRRWLAMEDAGAYVIEDHLVVKLGRLFEDAVPLAAVASAAPGRHRWWEGAGVRLRGLSRLAVVTSGKGIVDLRFGEPVRLRVAPFLRPRFRELRLSLEDAEGFLAELAARGGGRP